MMKAAYLVESNNWDDPIIEDTFDYSELPIQVLSARFFTLGRKAFHDQDREKLSAIISTMSDSIGSAQDKALMASSSMCGGSYNWKRPSNNNINRSHVMLTQLKALDEMLANI